MLHREYAGYPMDVRDGVKVILPGGWFLVRGSNTEPIIRVIAEAERETDAREIIAGGYRKVQGCINSYAALSQQPGYVVVTAPSKGALQKWSCK
jgi:hypothetical protein